MHTIKNTHIYANQHTNSHAYCHSDINADKHSHGDPYSNAKRDAYA